MTNKPQGTKRKPVLSPVVPLAADLKSFSEAREWIPVMLQKGPNIVLALICWTMAGLLQVLIAVSHRNHGFPMANNNAVYALRYMPTIAVIILVFVWRSLIEDVKFIMPYSVMSGRWRESSKSLLLDYVDPMEIKSLWSSARNRHWVAFLALVVGFLSGAVSFNMFHLHARSSAKI